ncbi:hypothetical protein ES707_05820 [subsurface metagenome]
MSEPERLIVGVVLTGLGFLVPAFILHASPRLADHPAGFVLEVSTATLILSRLIDPLAKCGTSRPSRTGRLIPMRSLLTFHVYAAQLATLRSAYGRQATALATRDTSPDGRPTVSALPSLRVLKLADGIADLGYAVASREPAKNIFLSWIGAHVAAAITLYFLLALHVATENRKEMRWLS